MDGSPRGSFWIGRTFLNRNIWALSGRTRMPRPAHFPPPQFMAEVKSVYVMRKDTGYNHFANQVVVSMSPM